MVTFRIEHETRYEYESRVSTSQHVAWLEPRELPFQRVRGFDLLVDPWPARLIRRIDYFGNVVHQFELLRPHDELSVLGRSRVEVEPRQRDPESGPDLPWEQVRGWLTNPPAERATEIVQYLGRSPHVIPTLEIAAFARESFI